MKTIGFDNLYPDTARLTGIIMRLYPTKRIMVKEYEENDIVVVVINPFFSIGITRDFATGALHCVNYINLSLRLFANESVSSIFFVPFVRAALSIILIFPALFFLLFNDEDLLEETEQLVLEEWNNSTESVDIAYFEANVAKYIAGKRLRKRQAIVLWVMAIVFFITLFVGYKIQSRTEDHYWNLHTRFYEVDDSCDYFYYDDFKDESTNKYGILKKSWRNDTVFKVDTLCRPIFNDNVTFFGSNRLGVVEEEDGYFTVNKYGQKLFDFDCHRGSVHGIYLITDSIYLFEFVKNPQFSNEHYGILLNKDGKEQSSRHFSLDAYGGTEAYKVVDGFFEYDLNHNSATHPRNIKATWRFLGQRTGAVGGTTIHRTA